MWHFPLINPVNSFDLEHYLNHVYEELGEFQDAQTLDERAKEVLDVLHASETLVRKFFLEHPELDVKSMKEEIINKNKTRGYYS